MCDVNKFRIGIVGVCRGNAFMKMLKDAHDKYGMKVQLNVFLRTDFYYGNDD